MALRDLFGSDLLRLPMPVQDQPAEVAPLDILVLQTRRIGAEIGGLESDDAQMPPLAHYAIEDFRLVSQ